MEELLNLSRMAKRLGVTIRWLRDEADAGRIPCLKAGGRYLFNSTAVQQALAQRAAGKEAGTEAQPPASDGVASIEG